MKPEWYQPIFILFSTVLCLAIAMEYSLPPTNRQSVCHTDSIAIFISLILAAWLGFRPVDSPYFGDTFNYALEYEMLSDGIVNSLWNGEWIWSGLMGICNWLDFSVEMFFFLIELLYLAFTLWVLRRTMRGELLIGLSFFLSSAMFYSYGINGIRNGLACQIALLAIVFLCDRNKWSFLFWGLIAFFIHRSVGLPLLCSIVGYALIKDFKIAIMIWIIALCLSLMIGDGIVEFMRTMDIDERFSTYTAENIDQQQFAKVGFRWDFVLYSMIPMAMIIYVSLTNNANDLIFRILGITFILSNAFWLLLIRIPFSNRIGYLSWFLTPMILAYPLVKFKIFPNQDRALSIILVAYVISTWIILAPQFP